MKVEVCFTHQALAPERCIGKTAVVIDVLRATSVIATALSVGYKAVYTVPQPQDAFALKAKHPNYHLAGERNADKIKGFDFSNSPTELIENDLDKEALVLCTSNGTQALEKVKTAKKIYALAFVNMMSVVEKVAAGTNDVIVLCAGTHGQFSLDDSLAAALFIRNLSTRVPTCLTDREKMLIQWAQIQRNIDLSLQDAMHYITLQQKGLQKDIDICLKIDSIPLTPQWKQGCFTL